MTPDPTSGETAESSSAAREDEPRGSETNANAGEADDSDDAVTRRSFVRTAGATAGAAGAAAAGVAGADDAAGQAERYEFGGDTLAWQGRAPSGIEGEENPTIELEAGTEYEFWFENVDGQPHNIAVQDADGNTLAESDTVSEEGATASLTFTATAEMAQYICIVHPTTMVGDLEIAGGAEGSGEGGEESVIPPVETLLMLGALVMAFVSPVLFAVFLFTRNRGGGEGEGDLPAR